MASSLDRLGSSLINAVLGGLILWVGQTTVRHAGVLAGVLGLAGLKLLDVPGAGAIVVVGLAAGAVALLVWIGRHSWIRLQRSRIERLPSAVD